MCLFFKQKWKEKLRPKDLRESMNWLLELATCPICLGTLQSNTTLCINGHPICVECRQNLQICPTCRDPFSNVRPTGFIHQVIQSLPHPCRHAGCTQFVKTNDNHEDFCGHKLTECKYCDWIGPGYGILSHLQTGHQETPLEHPERSCGPPFNPKEEGSVFCPIFVEGQFFWGEMKNDLQNDKLIAVIHPVPTGKTVSVFFSNVSLKLNKERYVVSLKLNMNPTADPYKDNCILIPTSILQKYIDEQKLIYRFFVTKSKWKSFKNVLEMKIDYLRKLVHFK
uniref:RING-type domain-containing protein n=1 Tax=Graphocephala atropunctata TaxID=36148 RepID=A0A1B6LL98_9HEMI